MTRVKMRGVPRSSLRARSRTVPAPAHPDGSAQAALVIVRGGLVARPPWPAGRLRRPQPPMHGAAGYRRRSGCAERWWALPAARAHGARRGGGADRGAVPLTVEREAGPPAALPAPDGSPPRHWWPAAARPRHGSARRSSCGLFAEVLGCPERGRRGGQLLRDLGGHSLLATRLAVPGPHRCLDTECEHPRAVHRGAPHRRPGWPAGSWSFRDRQQACQRHAAWQAE